MSIGYKFAAIPVNFQKRYKKENLMFSDLSQLFKFMRVYRKFWMAPIILGLVALGGLLILAQGSAIAPFIYAIF